MTPDLARSLAAGVSSMLPSELAEVARAALAEQDAYYATDPWAWACEQVMTVDEATSQVLPFPKEKLYLKELLQAFEELNWIIIPKSRRMMVSWIGAIYAVWKCRYFPATAVFWQSANEDRASFVVDKRCAWVENNLRDAALRKPLHTIRTTKGSIGRINWPNGSYVWAVASGGDTLRSFTPSILFSDEIEFQPDAHEAMAASLPLLEKKAKVIFVSTSNGPRGPLAQICKQIGLVKYQP